MRRLASLAILAVTGFSLGPVQAEGLKFASKNRAGLFRTQTSVLDSRAASQYANSVRLQPRKFEAPTNYAPAFRGKYNGPYLAVAREAAQRHGVPEDLFLRLVQQLPSSVLD